MKDTLYFILRLWLSLASLCLASLCLVFNVSATEIAVPPVVDASALPMLGNDWLKSNPYRGNAKAVEIGQSAFNQSCARCHGVDAMLGGGVPAPDLRQLNRYCQRIADTELKAACMRDNDQYFSKTVQQGKIIVGVMHMPPWKGVLSQELVWAIQTFIESRAR